jgi:hypothetical protein
MGLSGHKKTSYFYFRFSGTGIHNLMPHLPYKNLLYYTNPQFNFGHGVNWVPNIGKFDHFVSATGYL